MGFFSSLFGCNKPSDDTNKDRPDEQASTFVSEAAFEANRVKQTTMAPQTMEQLRGYGVTDESKLKLEYFFYTNTKEKAEALAKKLAGRGYSGKHDVAAGDPSQFVITGWTTPMSMRNEVVVSWTGEMCDIGYRFDCEFDGWGTNPNQ
ncbi:hypothetical protein Rhal01_03406 [Rubritalea halochordaticola]|uniref:Regulator of ribonuclease activity B domain-containing protein n=2 Tax=Rubritalea halochordaticola TaxID=714537 RepID=A0ABP9V3I1_9BACT